MQICWRIRDNSASSTSEKKKKIDKVSRFSIHASMRWIHCFIRSSLPRLIHSLFGAWLIVVFMHFFSRSFLFFFRCTTPCHTSLGQPIVETYQLLPSPASSKHHLHSYIVPPSQTSYVHIHSFIRELGMGSDTNLLPGDDKEVFRGTRSQPIGKLERIYVHIILQQLSRSPDWQWKQNGTVEEKSVCEGPAKPVNLLHPSGAPLRGSRGSASIGKVGACEIG